MILLRLIIVLTQCQTPNGRAANALKELISSLTRHFNLTGNCKRSAPSLARRITLCGGGGDGDDFIAHSNMFVRSFGWIPRRRRRHSRSSSMRNSVSIESCRRCCSLNGRSLRYAAVAAVAAVAIIAYKGSALRKRANNERASQRVPQALIKND